MFVNWIMKPVGAIFVAVFLGVFAPQASKTDRAKGLLAAISTQDKGKVEAFVKESFSSKVDSSWPLDQRVAALMNLAEYAPLAFGKVLADKPNELIFSLTGKSGSLKLEAKLDFDADAPFGIIGVRVGMPGTLTVPPPKKYTEWKALPELLEQIRKDAKVPAISAAIVYGGSEQMAVVGLRELGKPEAAEAGDTWIIGSITKSMTGMLVARLVDRGKLRWDSTVGELLSGMPMRDEYKKVTMLQLLRHRSGLPQDQTVTSEFLDKSVGTDPEPMAIRARYARHLLMREPIAKPDEKMAYSNAGYALVGHIVEVLEKKPYEQLLQELVFEPLGMKSARFAIPGTPGNPGAEGQIKGHLQGDDGLTPFVMDDPRLRGMFAPAGAGTVMTVGDLLKYADYHLKGLRGTVTLMSKANFETLHQPAPGSKYACGWSITSGATEVPFHGHNGSDGTFLAQMAIWPEKDLAVVSIMNAGDLRPMPPTMQVVVAAFDRFGK